MEIQINEFQSKERDSVRHLWEYTFKPDSPRNQPDFVIDQILKVAPDLFLTATKGGVVIGTVIGGYDGHRGWIYNLVVEDLHRGLGIGRALVQEIEKRLQIKGAVKINLQVRTSNRSVISFYQRLGFEIEERISMGKVLTQE